MAGKYLRILKRYQVDRLSTIYHQIDSMFLQTKQKDRSNVSLPMKEGNRYGGKRKDIDCSKSVLLEMTTACTCHHLGYDI